MPIAVDFRAENRDAALYLFEKGVWEDLAMLHPHIPFIFITTPAATLPAGNNITERVMPGNSSRWLNRIRLRRALAAWNASIYISMPGNAWYIQPVSGNSRSLQPLPPAHHCITIAGKIQPPASTVRPLLHIDRPLCRTVITGLPWAAAESTRTQYTGGRSFFLFAGNMGGQHALIDLLKAFSVFKKWQQSNMQLVIAGFATPETALLEEKLLNYKYRQDVVLLETDSEEVLARLAAASYAMLYPAGEEAFPFGLLLALQSGKAVIASDTRLARQANPAACWVSSQETADGFAKAMIQLYKDERQQQSLARQAEELAAGLSRSRMLQQVWACLEE